MTENYRGNFMMSKHVPQPHYTTLFCPDPDLGLTPERESCQHCNKKSVRFKSPSKPKAKRKVEMSGKENAGLDGIELTSMDFTADKSTKNKSVKNSKLGRGCRRSTTSDSRAERHIGTARGVENTGEMENHLDTPELHTTLNLGRDILKLQTMNIDIVEAVKHRLTVSEYDRSQVKQKTFAKLNERPKSPSAFSQTVSLNVPAEVVVGETERLMSKAVKPLPPRPKPDARKPSLMKFFKPELAFQRCLMLNQHGYQPKALQIQSPKIDQAVYDHHDRIAVWTTK